MTTSCTNNWRATPLPFEYSPFSTPISCGLSVAQQDIFPEQQFSNILNSNFDSNNMLDPVQYDTSKNSRSRNRITQPRVEITVSEPLRVPFKRSNSKGKKDKKKNSTISEEKRRKRVKSLELKLQTMLQEWSLFNDGKRVTQERRLEAAIEHIEQLRKQVAEQQQHQNQQQQYLQQPPSPGMPQAIDCRRFPQRANPTSIDLSVKPIFNNACTIQFDAALVKQPRSQY
eukprot:CAMPEP_0168523620 /NCGR_PEP_ID=MMETSP0405-20121227/10103_1 /TAXON_ID=498012 /ORGANISM="Trichosphaerium sp, Strain Am-I-7 wt" /LENGTH=227 /DNA_ID=CAMNT_0008545551 /DNA_START=14 /DNA_END=697 /DNA_ORIENTATION=+